MQVTKVRDHINHALINNKKTQEFRAANSAEFFHVLSDTLYSNKIMAVCREIMCNAWDSHIESGKEDQPIEVTLTRDSLTIRDFGAGIPTEKMGEIYAVYGNSTKKDDGTQTGGFGLGSKSPFAYVEHFEITNKRDGVKTVYNASKSSAEVNGMPGITEILSLPIKEEETGITVKLDIEPTDRIEFRKCIKEVAYFGGMLVHLHIDGMGENKNVLPHIEEDKLENGFILLCGDYANAAADYGSHILIRYGNVIYPLSNKSGISLAINRVERILADRGGYTYQQRLALILQAKPNSISITPSRESVSMTESTIREINALLNKFIQYHQANFQKHTDMVLTNYWKKLVQNVGVFSFLASPDIFPKKVNTINDISYDLSLASICYLRNSVRMGERYLNLRLKIALENDKDNKLDQGQAQTFLRAVKIARYVKPKYWFLRHIYAPLRLKMDSDSQMDSRNIRCYLGGSLNLYGQPSNEVALVDNLNYMDVKHYLSFLRNIVVVSYNQKAVKDRIQDFPEFGGKKSALGDFFVYTVKRNKKDVAYALEFFKNQGMHVIDLTKVYDWEKDVSVEPIKKTSTGRPKKHRLQGLPLLSTIATKSNIGLEYDRLVSSHEDYPNIVTTENPEFIVQVNRRAGSNSLIHGSEPLYERLFAIQYGDRGGICRSQNQVSKYSHDGDIPYFKEWLINRYISEAKKSARFRKALGLCFDIFSQEEFYQISYRYSPGKPIYTFIICNPEVSKKFGISTNLTEEQQLMFDFLTNGMGLRYPSPFFSILVRRLREEKGLDLKPNKKGTDLAERLSKAKDLDAVQIESLKNYPPDDIVKVFKILF